MDAITFAGYRDGYGRTTVLWQLGNGVPSRLSTYLDKVNHSPDGFEWGYEGSGPAQLAFAILYAYFSMLGIAGNTKERVMPLYQEFKRDIVAKFPKKGWALTDIQIEDWLKEHTNA